MQAIGIPADTPRYYERVKLIPRIGRDRGGRRRLSPADLERLRFIQRTQAMDFSLAEIRQLLQLRERPGNARPDVLRLAADKLAAIEQRLATLRHLRNELALLTNLCNNATEGFPILEDLAKMPRKRS
jgi:MerR family copper efflux transcriptional regulator